MKEQIEQLLAEVRNLTCKTEKDIEDARVRLLGKKGEITKLFDEFRTIAPELKREFGQKLNVLKKEAAAKIEELKANAQAAGQAADDSFDATLPGDIRDLGSRHPVSIARQQIVSIFRKFGYDVAEGPEIEDDYHVFEALNFPPNHPARDMQDTFFVSAGHPNPLLLRTHTSSVQVRAMEKMQLPIRVICWTGIQERGHLGPRTLHFPPGGGPLYRRECHIRRSEAGHPALRPRDVRP